MPSRILATTVSVINGADIIREIRHKNPTTSELSSSKGWFNLRTSLTNFIRFN